MKFALLRLARRIARIATREVGTGILTLEKERRLREFLANR